MSVGLAEQSEFTLSFDEFWSWLERHHNCIVRVGTPGALLFDLEALHWHLTKEDDRLHIISLCKAKELIGEVIIPGDDVAYVQVSQFDSNECIFEVLVETPVSREAAYQFVMSHGFDEKDDAETRSWAH